MEVDLIQGNSILNIGFTTYSTTLNSGQTYGVAVDPSYGGCTFAEWEDSGSTSASRSVSLTSNAELTAVYTCIRSTLVVSAQQTEGTKLTGYHVMLLSQSGPVSSFNSSLGQACYTVCTFSVDNGQTYQVLVDNYGSETFSHWSDNQGYLYSWGGLHPVTIPGGSGSSLVGLTAIFSQGPSSSTAMSTTTNGLSTPRMMTSSSSTSIASASGTAASSLIGGGFVLITAVWRKRKTNKESRAPFHQNQGRLHGRRAERGKWITYVLHPRNSIRRLPRV